MSEATNGNGRQWKWLERDRYSSLRQLSVKGKRKRAWTLYADTIGADAQTPEQVAENHYVPLEAVLEAIEYCKSDPPEIREDREESQRSYEDAVRRGVTRSEAEVRAILKEKGIE